MIVLDWLFLTVSPVELPWNAGEPWQLGSQDAATPMMQGIIDLHHDIFFFLILILVFVSWILVRTLWHFHYKKNPIPQRIVHGTTIEILWTIFPSIILMFIAIPSFALLYSMDEVVVDPAITIKAIGHQWYRTYEYSDYNSSDEQSLTFDSYMIPEDDPELGQSRLLEVDNRVVVPAKTHLRIIVTSADVLHSWAVPSLGVKCDAVPGRLNQTSISVQREGVYYGQCSEICGTNHAFMPIVVEAVDRKDYGSRVENQLIPQTGQASPGFIACPQDQTIYEGIPVYLNDQTIYEGVPVPADRILEALSSPFYCPRLIHIPGGIEDPLTLFRVGNLNGLLFFLPEDRFHGTRADYTRGIQLELDRTEAAALPAKLDEIFRRELARFRISDE
uniref:cytochrome oxidase subunit 2 n=1 Tax=Psychotria serpens TaxID=77896 RepID=UPI0022FD4E65|nr:cytochrome oxidase subunit 2 [Psychotria serpens]UIG86769.1 cytochrome oxidase subunit 2 [Psychotria serpens]